MMSPSRIIQDSDESENESGYSLEGRFGGNSTKFADRPEGGRDGSSPLNGQPSWGTSTGDTDRINRDIVAAHMNLMQPTPTQNTLRDRTQTTDGPPSQAPSAKESRDNITTRADRTGAIGDIADIDYTGGQSPRKRRRDVWEFTGSSPTYEAARPRRSTAPNMEASDIDADAAISKGGKKAKRSKTTDVLRTNQISQDQKLTDGKKLAKRSKTAVTAVDDLLRADAVSLFGADALDPTGSAPENSFLVDLSNSAALTSSQREQYEQIGTHLTPQQDSTAQTGEDTSNWPDPFIRYPGESSTMPDITPEPVNRDAQADTENTISFPTNIPSSPPLFRKTTPQSSSKMDVTYAETHADSPSSTFSAPKLSQRSDNNHEFKIPKSPASSHSQITYGKRKKSKRAKTMVQRPTFTLDDDSEDELVAPSTLLAEMRASVKPERARPSTEANIKDGQTYSKPEDLESDDLAFEVAPEQYKPRPSRRRSNKLGDELFASIDFSKRVEANAKAKRKKSNGHEIPGGETSTNDQQTPRDCDTSEKTEVMEVTEITGATGAQKAAASGDRCFSRNDADQTAEGASTHKVDRPEDQNLHQEDELPPTGNETSKATIPQAEPARKRGRPRKKSNQTHPVAEPETTEAPGQSTAIEELDSDNRSEDDPVKLAPKRKRGARRKNSSKESGLGAKASEKEDELQTSASRNSSTSRETMASVFDQNQILKETTSNSQGTRADTTSKVTSPARETQSKAPNLTPPTPKNQAAKTAPGTRPGSHSPLNSSKVPYRVGLSKRARIAPLLRCVKKG